MRYPVKNKKPLSLTRRKSGYGVPFSCTELWLLSLRQYYLHQVSEQA